MLAQPEISNTTSRTFSAASPSGGSAQTPSYSTVLVPFTDPLQLQQIFEPTLETVKSAPAKLILLRVYTTDPTARRAEEESLFSELKGVQAQSQLLPVAAQIDTVAGPMADSIVDYADRHGVDLIVVSSHAEEGRQLEDGKSVARKVARHARCDTLIVG